MSERVKALGLALGANSPDKWGGQAPTACCPTSACGEPLISTMHWPGYEFLCICCGRHVGFVDPVPRVAAEVADRYAELEAEWKAAKTADVDLDEWLRERVEGRA